MKVGPFSFFCFPAPNGTLPHRMRQDEATGEGCHMRRKRCHRSDAPLPAVCAAFGLGAVLALFCSIKLVAVLAALGLVVLGIRSL